MNKLYPNFNNKKYKNKVTKNNKLHKIAQKTINFIIKSELKVMKIRGSNNKYKKTLINYLFNYSSLNTKSLIKQLMKIILIILMLIINNKKLKILNRK